MIRRLNHQNMLIFSPVKLCRYIITHSPIFEYIEALSLSKQAWGATIYGYYKSPLALL